MRNKVILFFIAIAIMLLDNTCYALFSSTAIWNGINIIYNHNSKFIYSLMFENRHDFNMSSRDEFLTRPAVGYLLTENFDVWLGYDIFLPYRHALLRQAIWEQGQYDIVNKQKILIVARIRLEQRYQNQSKGTAVRLRERLLFNLYQNKYISPVIYDEIFLNINHPSWVSKNILSQNRIFLGVNISIRKKFDFLLGYLNRLNMNSNSKLMQNIFYVTINFNFGGKISDKEEFSTE